MTPEHSVFVSHFGLQHSHQLALALHEEDMLQAYWSGVPVTADEGEVPFWLPRRYKQRVRRVNIPRSLRRHPTTFQLLARAGTALPLPFSKSDYFHRMQHAYDWWVSRHITKLRPKVVVAYENAAYHTFRAAKAIGAVCVLDAPAMHHATVARLMTVSHTAYTDEINRRKDAEVAQADLVLTCSPLAARSYTDQAVPEDKVSPLLLGAELPFDQPPPFIAHERPRFLFAGVLSYHKAIDTIVAVFRRLHQEGTPCEVQFVGGVGSAELLAQVLDTPNASYHASVPQHQLYPMLGQADCLLLPSRFDSFGMVVAEAMACGTPALVSTQTGARAIIEQHPGSGWIVEPNAESLYAQVRALATAPHALRAARAHALRAAQDFTWQSYRRRARALFRERLSS